MEKLDPRATWLFFVSFLFQAAIVSFTLVFTGVVMSIRLADTPAYFFVVAALLVIGAPLIAYACAKLTYTFYKFELRDDSFRKEHGVIVKKYIAIPYDRIQNVDISRGIFARLLGLSTLHIQTAGSITFGSYGASSEGVLMGVSKERAEELRDALIERAKNARSQGV